MSRAKREPGYKKLYVLLSVIALLIILLFATSQGKYRVPLSERIVSVALSPFQGVMMRASYVVADCTSSLWEIATVYQQNKMLKSEVEQLRQMQINSTEIIAENERLKVLLNYKQETTQFDLLAAKVIARDSSDWTNSIIIERGMKDGVAKNMAVVTPKGLVGSVSEVFDNCARVRLIIDPRNSVGGIVQRAESRVAGVVDGDTSNRMMVKLTNVPRDADIVESDTIITSGFGGIYPKGILIGTISRIENEAGGLLKYAVVKPAVDFQRLEEVSVILYSREPMPEITAKEGGSSGGQK
jgi:rod shape-determining protein MreC